MSDGVRSSWILCREYLFQELTCWAPRRLFSPRSTNPVKDKYSPLVPNSRPPRTSWTVSCVTSNSSDTGMWFVLPAWTGTLLPGLRFVQGCQRPFKWVFEPSAPAIFPFQNIAMVYLKEINAGTCAVCRMPMCIVGLYGVFSSLFAPGIIISLLACLPCPFGKPKGASLMNQTGTKDHHHHIIIFL